jgi:Outer membrane efflux protein
MQKVCSCLAAAAVVIGIIDLQEVAKATPPGKPAPRAQPVRPPSTPSASKPVFFNLHGYTKAVLAMDPGLIASRFAQLSNEKETESIRASYLPYLRGDGELGVIEGANRFGLFAPSSTQERVTNPVTQQPQFINEPQQVKTLGFDWYSIFGPTLTMPFFKDGSFLGINTPPAVNIKRAEGQVLAATARLDAQEVMYRATDLFLQAIATSNEAKIMRDHLDWVQKQNDLIHEQAKFNLVSEADLIVADTKLAETKIEVLLAGQRAVDAFFRVGELLGIEDPNVIRIDTRYPEAKPLPSFESTVLRTSVNHPRVEIEQARVHQAQADVALKRAQLMPTGQIVSAYRFGNNLQDVGQARWTSFLALSAPIFDFGERYKALKAADFKVDEEKELVLKAHQEVRQAIFDAFTRLRQVLEQQSAIAALVAERQTAVDRLEELNKYERAPIPQLITAQLALFEAKRSEEGIHYAVLLASAGLERATAGQWKWMR